MTTSGACRICGKTLTREGNQVRGIGPTCVDRVERCLRYGEALTGRNAVDERRLEEITRQIKENRGPNWAQRVPKAPDGRSYVSVSDMHKFCVRNEVLPAWMAYAIGGDRAVSPPLNEKWKPYYVEEKGRDRYLYPDVMTEAGLEELRAAYGQR